MSFTRGLHGSACFLPAAPRPILSAALQLLTHHISGRQRLVSTISAAVASDSCCSWSPRHVQPLQCFSCRTRRHRAAKRRGILRALSASYASAEVMPAAASGKLECMRLRGDVRNRVQSAIKALGYEVTPGDVSAQAGVTLAEAEEALTALAADSLGTLKVSEQGDIVYCFRRDFDNVILSRSMFLRMQPGLKATGKALATGGRAAFGAALMASVALVYVSILVLLSSDREGNDRGHRRGGGLGTYIWLDSPAYRSRPTYREPGSMDFLQAVFSFVLGDGDPNKAYEEERWQALGNFIKSRGGVVTAEEMAPYLDHATEYSALNPESNEESYVLPALIRFSGSPELDKHGNILYHFPSLQVSGSTPSPRPLPPKPQLESRWQLSRASPGQKVGVMALAAVNIAGVLILQTLLNSRSIALAIYKGTSVGAYAVWISRLMPFLAIYAASFFVVPAVRQVLNASRNRKIDARNDSRNKAHALLKEPTRLISQKLETARDEAKHRRITDKDVIYRTDRNQIEQSRDMEGEEFDRRLAQSSRVEKVPRQQGGGDGITDALSRVRQLFKESS